MSYYNVFVAARQRLCVFSSPGEFKLCEKPATKFFTYNKHKPMCYCDEHSEKKNVLPYNVGTFEDCSNDEYTLALLLDKT